ncbi:hypothetical protein TWF106_005906 [Orbilia oligospora]|uniref:CHCH domain-containing protein n=1 Tax=Orbilia oligospora TaxID=2813651 RepID=A0A6G1LQL5_ORBOL|nr:hypothetical protein TWF788_004783 [Orbilia oligospora]KAF3195020.1 hypothetical protein TWF106_005906 [Orbilia oligospora]KAF3230711.1 hypothetical protein TWF192_004515 [Orbilia oligospora]KAF3230975.1 hypothetical protein TWF191_007709 [Orbilia oligospora]
MLPKDDSRDDDEWDIRIQKTGCAWENENLQICFDKNKDWRVCQKQLQEFKNCWERYKKDEADTGTKRVD